MGWFKRGKKAVRGRDPRVGPDPVVDVREPVTNPELLDAIARFASERNRASEEAMLIAFARAVYLTPVAYDPPLERDDVLPEGTTISYGSMDLAGTPGVVALPVCTDQQAVTNLAGPGVSTQILLANDAFTLATTAPYGALLLNPGSERFIGLDLEQCQRIRELLGA